MTHQPASAERVTIRALDPINHDGTRYEPGALLVVTEAQASRLVLIGAAEPFGAPLAESPALPAAVPASSPDGQGPHLSETADQPKRAKRAKA